MSFAQRIEASRAALKQREQNDAASAAALQASRADAAALQASRADSAALQASSAAAPISSFAERNKAFRAAAAPPTSSSFQASSAAAPISSFAERNKAFRAAAALRDGDESTRLQSSQFSQRMQRPPSQQPIIFFHNEFKDYGFLSNFYLANFLDPISKIEFTSSEKYYMAAKAVIANQAQSFHDIMETNDPFIAKEYGSSFEVPGDWEWIKENVMENACYFKFSQNKKIAQDLLDTGDAYLVEAAPKDKVWGIGMSEKQARQTDPSMWPGTNLLGKVLMRVRNHLKDGTMPEDTYIHIILDFLSSEELKRIVVRSSQTSSQQQHGILISQQQQPQRQRPGIRSMGFSESYVKGALKKANGDEQQAIGFLIHDLVTTLLTAVRQNNKSWINREDVEGVVRENLNKPNVYGESLAQLIDIPRPKGYIEEGANSELAARIRDMPEIKVGGAGNCLFLSLVGSLGNLFEHLGDDVAALNPALDNEASMRIAIVDFESEHYNQEIFYQAAPIDSESPQLQKLYLNDPNGSVGEKEVYYDEENVHKYFNSMAKDGTYGTEVEIMAAARMFGVTIFVQIEQGNHFTRYSSSSNPDEDETVRAIYLFKGNVHNHYDWKDPYEEHLGGKQKQQKQQKQKSRKINCKKLSKRYSRYKKNLYKYSSPTQAQKMATKYLGKTAKLYPANNPVKKYRICDPVSKKWVNFGQLGYEDYTRHKNKTRRHNYLTRSAGMSGNWKKNKYSANNLSRRILWN